MNTKYAKKLRRKNVIFTISDFWPRQNASHSRIHSSKDYAHGRFLAGRPALNIGAT